jgi:leader peptidase (prepilin peptidase)/N-methyltransferase
MELNLTAAGIAIVSVFGVLIGSFLNVVIVRRAHVDWRERRSIGGRSECPTCGHSISWYENLPVISYVALRGKCRGCRTRISWRYPLVELLTGGLWALVAWSAGDVADLVTGLFFVSLLIPVTFIDLELRIIPDEINYALIWIGFACSLGFGPQSRFAAGPEWWWTEVLIASVAASGFLLLPAIITRGRGMGLGDVKLAMALGAFLGAPVAVGLFAGFVIALIPSIALMVIRGIRQGRKSTIPFGPYLAAGGVIGWLWGAQMLDAYLQLGA